MTRFDELGAYTTDDVLNHAMYLLQQGEPRSVLLTLRQIGPADSGYAGSLHLSAEAYRMLGAWDQEERVAREAVAREIAPVKFLSMLAEALAMQSRTDEAVEACERALAGGGHGSLWVLLVDALCKAGRVDEAFARIEAIPPRERDESMWLAAGLVGAARKDWIHAEKAFRACIDLAPDHAKAHYSLGRVYIQLEQMRRAAKHLARAAELDPFDEEIQLHFILSIVGSRDKDRFAEEMHRIGARSPRIADRIALELRNVLLEHTHEEHSESEVPQSGNEEPGENG